MQGPQSKDQRLSIAMGKDMAVEAILKPLETKVESLERGDDGKRAWTRRLSFGDGLMIVMQLVELGRIRRIGLKRISTEQKPFHLCSVTERRLTQNIDTNSLPPIYASSYHPYRVVLQTSTVVVDCTSKTKVVEVIG